MNNILPLICLLMVSIALAEQPASPPPKEWRGIEFGISWERAMRLADSLFTVKKRDDIDKAAIAATPAEIEAETKIDGKPAVVRLRFEPNLKQLWEITYKIESDENVFDQILDVFKFKYGSPSAKIDVPSIPDVYATVYKWIWTQPQFIVSIMDLHIAESAMEAARAYDNMQLQYTVTVHYTLRDVDEKLRKDATKKKVDEY